MEHSAPSTVEDHRVEGGGGGWPLVGRCPPPRDGGGSGRLPWRSAQACGVAFIAAESRVQHALAVCRHTRACVRVRPVAEARP